MTIEDIIASMSTANMTITDFIASMTTTDMTTTTDESSSAAAMSCVFSVVLVSTLAIVMKNI
jgi:hypothetical protein